jgi:hemolysin activation/secretion protein
MIWKADGSLDQTLPRDFHLIVRLAAQYSADPVASNEQFLLGGAQSVRGYLEAEELGDVGTRESVELRAPALHVKSLNLMSYAFVDNGHVRLQQPLPGEPGSQSLLSLGLGLDFELTRFLTGTFVWALPLIDGTYTASDSSRWLFAVRSSW